MANQYFQVKIEFQENLTQDVLKNEIIKDSNTDILIDEYSNELQAENSLILTLLIVLANEAWKSLGKESIKWFFEYIKKKIESHRSLKESDQIILKIKIESKEFLFMYDPVSKDYNIEEI